MIAAKYRKKPVTVEAVRWHDDGTPDYDPAEHAEAIVRWISEMSGDAHYLDLPDLDPYISIHTLEGMIYASFGDWVIRGVEGEFYPCKDSVFQVSYTSVGRG